METHFLLTFLVAIFGSPFAEAFHREALILNSTICGPIYVQPQSGFSVYGRSDQDATIKSMEPDCGRVECVAFQCFGMFVLYGPSVVKCDPMARRWSEFPYCDMPLDDICHDPESLDDMTYQCWRRRQRWRYVAKTGCCARIETCARSPELGGRVTNLFLTEQACRATCNSDAIRKRVQTTPRPTFKTSRLTPSIDESEMMTRNPHGRYDSGSAEDGNCRTNPGGKGSPAPGATTPHGSTQTGQGGRSDAQGASSSTAPGNGTSSGDQVVPGGTSGNTTEGVPQVGPDYFDSNGTANGTSPTNPTGIPASLAGNNTTTGSLVQNSNMSDILATHNKWRLSVVPDPVKPLVNLQWDNDLSRMAEIYASRCPEYEHPGTRSLLPKWPSGIGQNMAFSSWDDHTWPEIIDFWADERLNWAYGVGAIQPFLSVEHYTVMIASDSHFVGCSKVKCNAPPSKWRYVWVCNYAPTQAEDPQTKPYLAAAVQEPEKTA